MGMKTDVRRHGIESQQTCLLLREHRAVGLLLSGLTRIGDTTYRITPGDVLHLKTAFRAADEVVKQEARRA